LHPQWAQRLREETGLDTGYSRCGGLYLAHDEPAADELRQFARSHAERGVEALWLSPAEVCQTEPQLSGARLSGACLFPDECQLRNPRHVKALLVACGNQGVQIQSGTPIDDFAVRQGRIEAALSGGELLRAEQYCIAGGAWTRTILARLGHQVPIKPIRGQIVLLAGQHRVLWHVINDGHRYLVPRSDGRVLVGSTEEDAGFDKRTTVAAMGDLLHFALELVPVLRDQTVERTWAGLRPGNADGLPYLGRIPDLENAFIAAGHYRHGLHLSTGTAVVLSQLMRGEQPQVDLTPFRVDRKPDGS
jgi:glycine oxidase